MSDHSPESPLETFWRSTIMLGTLVVGGMGLYLYGPSAEKAAELVDQLATRVQELVRSDALGTPQTLASMQPEVPKSTLASPFAGNSTGQTLRPFITETSPAPPLLATRRPAPSTHLAAVQAELDQLGAEGVMVEPWGSGGDLYRIQFSAPMAGDAGFQRKFDAIRPTPTEAATVALAELREWRTGRAEPINR